jgi:hypothetical protein
MVIENIKCIKQNDGANSNSLISIEGAQEYIESAIELIKQQFKEDGYFNLITVIGAQINPETNEPYKNVELVMITPVLLGININGPESIQLYTDAIKFLSKKSKAIMVTTIMEAWKVIMKNKEDRASLPKSLEHAPGRIECINIVMEHAKLGTKSMFWSADITRDEKGHGTLGEFVGPTISDGCEGRFLGNIELLS